MRTKIYALLLVLSLFISAAAFAEQTTREFKGNF